MPKRIDLIRRQALSQVQDANLHGQTPARWRMLPGTMKLVTLHANMVAIKMPGVEQRDVPSFYGLPIECARPSNGGLIELVYE